MALSIIYLDAEFDRLKLQYKTCYIKKQPPEVFCKKGVLKNFTKFTGKHLCQSLFFNKVAGLRPATFKNTFFTEHLWTTASLYPMFL